MSEAIRGKALSYFDEIDLEILELLDSKARECVTGYGIDTGYGVLELRDKLNIRHQSLKPHLDKLLDAGLISTYKTPIRNEKLEAEKDENGNIKFKTLISSTLGGNKFWCECIFSGIDEEQKDYEEAIETNKEIEALMKYLKKVRSFISTNDAKKSIDYDLRKKATQERLQRTPIGTLTEKDNSKIIKIKDIKKRSKKVTTNK